MRVIVSEGVWVCMLLMRVVNCSDTVILVTITYCPGIHYNTCTALNH